jgi:hypothetical protein
MDHKQQPFTWDDEPAERITVFESSTQGTNSSWQDTALESRLQARRQAAKSGLVKMVALVVALLGVSGLALYAVSKYV